MVSKRLASVSALAERGVGSLLQLSLVVIVQRFGRSEDIATLVAAQVLFGIVSNLASGGISVTAMAFAARGEVQWIAFRDSCDRVLPGVLLAGILAALAARQLPFDWAAELPWGYWFILAVSPLLRIQFDVAKAAGRRLYSNILEFSWPPFACHFVGWLLHDRGGNVPWVATYFMAVLVGAVVTGLMTPTSRRVSWAQSARIWRFNLERYTNLMADSWSRAYAPLHSWLLNLLPFVFSTSPDVLRVLAVAGRYASIFGTVQNALYSAYASRFARLDQPDFASRIYLDSAVVGAVASFGVLGTFLVVAACWSELLLQGADGAEIGLLILVVVVRSVLPVLGAYDALLHMHRAWYREGISIAILAGVSIAMLTFEDAPVIFTGIWAVSFLLRPFAVVIWTRATPWK